MEKYAHRKTLAKPKRTSQNSEEELSEKEEGKRFQLAKLFGKVPKRYFYFIFA
jgi:hypothetical protein